MLPRDEINEEAMKRKGQLGGGGEQPLFEENGTAGKEDAKPNLPFRVVLFLPGVPTTTIQFAGMF